MPRKVTALDREAEQLAKDLVNRGICHRGILELHHHKPTEDVPTNGQSGHQPIGN